MGVRTKDKTLVRTGNSSSVNVCSGRLCITFIFVVGSLCFDGFGREFVE